MQLQHTPETLELQKIIRDMMKSSIHTFDNKKIYVSQLTLKQIYLLQNFGVIHSYGEAVFELCSQFRPKPALVLLRAMLEVWINMGYFLSHNSNNRLFALIMHDSFEKLGHVEEMEKFSNKYPWVTENSILSPNMLNNMRKKINYDLNKLREKGLRFSKKKDLENATFFEKNLLERARIADRRQKGKKNKNAFHPFEHQYQIVYRFLSDFTHVNLSGSNSFIRKNSHSYDLLLGQTSDDIEMELITLFIFYLSFIQKLKQYNIISNPKLGRYIRYFNKNI